MTVGENSAVAKMNVSATKLKAQNAKIDKAMETLHLKIEEVTKLGFQLRGAVADHVPQESQIFRPKRKS